MAPHILQQITILLNFFIPCFKQKRTFKYLEEFFKGFVTADRKTVTRIFLTTDKSRHFTNYYRFLKTHKWDIQNVAKTLLSLIQKCFEPIVKALPVFSENLIMVLDTTHSQKSGNKFDGVDMFFDHSSGKNKSKYIWGHCIFVLGVLFQIPGLGTLCLPFLASIYFRKATILKQNLEEEFVPMLEKAVNMVLSVKECCKKHITVVADAFFSKKNFFQPLMKQGVFVLSRMRHDATAYLPPVAVKKKRRGRPRKYGKKVKLKELLKTESLDVMEIRIGGRLKKIRYIMRDLLLRGVDFPVRFLVIKDKTPVILMTTNLNFCAVDILETYRSRFQIEFSFRDMKQHLGFEDYQVRRKEAISRFLNLTILVYSILKIIFATNEEVRRMIRASLNHPWRCSFPIFSIENLLSVVKSEYIIKRFFDMSGLQPEKEKIPVVMNSLKESVLERDKL